VVRRFRQRVVVVVAAAGIRVVNQIHYRHKVYLDTTGKVIPSSK
jgi:hypothetical protein